MARGQGRARQGHREARRRLWLLRGRPRDACALLLATTLLTGFLPRAGWIGAAAGAAVAVSLGSRFAGWALLIVWVAASAWAVERALRVSGTTDPRQITADEVAGAWLACLIGGAPAREALWTLPLFVLLDGLKPFPADRIEALPGARGVMGDDLVAGAYAGAAVQLARVLWSG